MAGRTELSEGEFVRITTAIFWLATTENEALEVFAPTNTTERNIEMTNEPEAGGEEEAMEVAPTSTELPTPTTTPHPADIAITLLMTATYTIRLFDALLMAYPGLRADMQDELDQFAQFIDQKAREWTGTGILEPSMIDEESEAGEL